MALNAVLGSSKGEATGLNYYFHFGRPDFLTPYLEYTGCPKTGAVLFQKEKPIRPTLELNIMTPPTNGSNTPYSEEEPHADEILRGLQLALDSEFGDSHRPITRLEQEKLCYFAVKEFDVPITYSWYLAGAYPKVAGDPDNAPGRISTNTPGFQQDHGESEDVRKYQEYFLTEEFFSGYELRDIWFTERFEFLCDFYEACAPDDYTELYITSTKLREKLRNVDDTTEQRSLTSFTSDSEEGLISEEKEDEFRLLISDLHLELAQIDELDEIVDVVTQGTDIIEQVWAQLTAIDSLNQTQKTILDDLGAYFYYTVWRYPSLYISTQTAEGPNSHHLVEEHATLFIDFHEELISESERMQRRCHEHGLYPEIGYHSSRVDEEQASQLHELAKEVIEGNK